MIYLDNAATSWPKPPEIFQQALKRYLAAGVSPGRGGYDAALEMADVIFRVRTKIARFFHAPRAERVIFTGGATDSLNMALRGYLRPQDHVVTTTLEHNSVLRPLHMLAKEQGVRLTLLPFAEETGCITAEQVEEAIEPETRLVVVTHASNVLGSVQPVAEVGKICRRRGVKLLVDASQSAGRIEVNMEEMAADLLVVTGHKSLLGPTGIGVLLLEPSVELQPYRFGGTGTRSESLELPPDYPDRLESGTHNLLGILGLEEALSWLERQGLDAVAGHEQQLFDRLCSGLAKISGVRLYCRSEVDNVGVLCCNVDGVDPEAVGAVLDGDFDIAVRVGLHCAPLVHRRLGTLESGAVRFSPGFFNSSEDIDRAVDAVAQLAARCRR